MSTSMDGVRWSGSLQGRARFWLNVLDIILVTRLTFVAVRSRRRQAIQSFHVLATRST